jgi:deoxyribodipyrimidine photo-lyase
MPHAASLVWFRLDLRLADHPALSEALQTGLPVIPIYIHCPEEQGDWAPGRASDWWLHQSLRALTERLTAIGSRLVIRRGPTLPTLLTLAKDSGARAVYWNRCYASLTGARDRQIQDALHAAGLKVKTFNSSLLFEPTTVTNQSGQPFKVFTPFWRRCLTMGDPTKPLSAPPSVPAPTRWPQSDPLLSLELQPQPDWAGGIRAAWRPGEAGAERQLSRFCEEAFCDYAQHRDRPDLEGTSRLSPHLHFGEVSPRQVWHRLKAFAEARNLATAEWRQSQFLAEVGWREFAHQLLYHFPQTPTQPLRPEFAAFPWRHNKDWLQAWQRGQTGYPIVDAGMRELWSTGWMHNRVRMITASFLVKDLLIDWREGARWFWDTLVDADLANNTQGWQWTAGCGADAAPYFRIFNPVIQGQKFDPDGLYVRRWIPELGQLPTKWIHHPWGAPLSVRAAAGVVLDKNYPAPIVSHAIAREVALEAMNRVKQRGSAG